MSVSTLVFINGWLGVATYLAIRLLQRLDELRRAYQERTAMLAAKADLVPEKETKW